MLVLRHLKMLFLLAGMGSLASADVLKIVDFSLSASGTFSPVTADLVFLPSSGFTGTSDADGFLPLSGLGTFTLTRPGGGLDRYQGEFTLDLAFFLPGGIHGEAVFDATVKVNRNLAHINFGKTQSFTFTNENASGGFDLTVDDVLLQLPHGVDTVSQTLTGNITNAFDPPAAVVPEPQALVLLGTAILLAWFAFRRRQALQS